MFDMSSNAWPSPRFTPTRGLRAAHLLATGALAALAWSSVARAGESAPPPFDLPPPQKPPPEPPRAADARPDAKKPTQKNETETTAAVLPPPNREPGSVDPAAGPPPAPTDPDAATDGTRDPDTTPEDALAASALLGYSTDELNLGVGLRVGKPLFVRHLYVGGTFVYQFGSSYGAQTPAGPVEASTSAFYMGPEVGYEFRLSSFVVRPYAGIGIASLRTSTSAPGGTSFSMSVEKLVIWPGATAVYAIKDSPWFVGADTRLLTVPGGPALGLFAFAGMGF